MSLGNKEIISENIKYYMDKHGVDRNKLCDDLDLKYMTVSDWINAKTYPRIDKIEMLADYFGITKADLVEKSGTQEKNISFIYNQLQPPRQKKVYSFAEHQLKEQDKLERKIYNLGTTAAGSALDYGDDFVEEEKLESIPKNADFVLTIKGSSMEPEIKDGTKVFVQSTPNIENGEIAIVEINDEAVTCKKVKFDYDNSKIVLESLNPEYKDMVFDKDQVRILGRVVK